MSLNKRTVSKLESLLELTDPSQLKHSLNEVFMNYLLNNKSNLPENFETIVEDFYYLKNFLERIDPNNN